MEIKEVIIEHDKRKESMLISEKYPSLTSVRYELIKAILIEDFGKMHKLSDNLFSLYWILVTDKEQS